MLECGLSRMLNSEACLADALPQLFEGPNLGKAMLGFRLAKHWMIKDCRIPRGSCVPRPLSALKVALTHVSVIRGVCTESSGLENNSVDCHPSHCLSRWCALQSTLQVKTLHQHIPPLLISSTVNILIICKPPYRANRHRPKQC